MPEFVRPFKQTRPPRIAVIDFDGTLSLLRAGWVEIMVDMMINVLQPLPGTTESAEELTRFICGFVLEMTGRATVFQMEYFVDVARARGGQPNSADFYTRQFLDALNAKSEERMTKLKTGELTVDQLVVPGTFEFLSDLQSKGVRLILASGTPAELVRREAKALHIDHYFAGRIFGPEADWRAFSKLNVMQNALAESGVDASEFLGVGDGFVETENAKQIGGLAIGCATDETHRSGRIEDWKRTLLIRAGADIVVPDHRDWTKLAPLLFP